MYWGMCTLFKVDEIYVAMLSVQIRSYLWSIFSVFGLNTKKYGPEITPYLDTFHAVLETILTEGISLSKPSFFCSRCF